MCGSVFGELESQAVDALDLPGCFRMRSHSYLRAIQAGCSQDDDCLPLLAAPASVSGRPGSCEYVLCLPLTRQLRPLLLSLGRIRREEWSLAKGSCVPRGCGCVGMMDD